MLDSKHHSQLDFFLDTTMHRPISIFGQKCLMELGYYFRPEDTTEGLGGRKNYVDRLEENRVCGVVKVMLWMVVAIAIPLTIGR